MNHSEAEIIASFASLRKWLDPRGWETLDALRDLALSQAKVAEEARKLIHGLETRAFVCDPDESCGYAGDDPKNNTWHSVRADLWDSRAGK